MLIPAQPQFASQEPPPAIERVIGKLVAAAARAIVRALMEYQNAGGATFHHTARG